MEIKKQILKSCMQKGFLLDKEILEFLSSFEENFSLKLIDFLSNLKIKERVITKSIFFESSEKIRLLLFSKKEQELFDVLLTKLGFSSQEHKEVETIIKPKESGIKILSSSLVSPKKIDVQDFVKHFRARYEQLKNILQERNLENLKSLRRISEERETQHVIVLILQKRVTKNKNLIFEVEDNTGRSKVLVNGKKPDLYEKCKNILVDEVVAFNVSGTKEMLFANDAIFPDAYIAEKRKTDKDVCIAFTSDVHVGSKMFLEENFLKFIKWLNGEEGTEEHKAMAKKIKYLFLVGDNIDGIGVFPDQERLLKIPEVTLQYKKLAEYLKLIRKDIKIIISPGQHDAVWVGEPQPSIGENWASDLHKMENVLLVTNPCLMELEEGFKVLVYHGASYHGIVEEIPDLRLKYKLNYPTLITKEVLKRRHLAPMHGECDYVPFENKDPLVIDIVPDIFVTGDLHRSEVSSYNNILLVSGSCWESITPFEEKVGNNPDPCKVPIFNLKTREVKILDFSTVKEENKLEVGKNGN